MTRPTGFDREMVACRPRLLAFARKLVRRNALAEDLVQEAMVRAMQSSHQFEPGTNMLAWLCMILRNQFLTGMRKGKREVLDADGIVASQVAAPAAQDPAYDVQIVFGFMECLNFEQRVSLELVAIDGMQYEEVGAILGIPAGTVKSQVSRARARLAELCGGRP